MNFLRIIAVLLLPVAAYAQPSTARAAAPPLLSGIIATNINGHVQDCEDMLLDEPIRQASETLAFQMLKAHIGLFTHAEDRLLIELSAKPQDVLLDQMSPEGKAEAASLLSRKLTYSRMAMALTRTTAMAEREAFDFLTSRSHEGLHRMMVAKGLSQWQEIITIYESLPSTVRSGEFAQQQYAFALNRAGRGAEAEAILWRLVAEGSENGETYGVLGRIFKDRYFAAKNDEDATPEHIQELLQQAIKIYRLGFLADTNNYYPVMPLIDLILELRSDAALQEAQDLLSAVNITLQRAISLHNADAWTYSSIVTVACMRGRWDQADAYVSEFLALTPEAWMIETSVESHANILENLVAMNATTLANGGQERFQALIDRMRAAQSSTARAAAAPAPTRVVTTSIDVTATTGAGVLHTTPFNIVREAAATGFGLDLDKFQRYGRAVMDPQAFLRQFDQNLGGSLLGMTKDHHRPLYQGYANATNLETWWEGYARMGIDATTDRQHTAHYMERITASGEPVVFLVPRGLYHSTSELSFTATEMEWILADPEHRARNVTFVFGAYELLTENFIRDLYKRRGTQPATDLLSLIIRGYQRHLVR